MGMWNWGKGKKKPQISTIVEVDSDRVSCAGETNDHPKVWYTVPEDGYVDTVTSCLCVRNSQKQKRWTNTSTALHIQRTE